jgi:4-amino-4-deoxy-L-arabinose transferase-like glycosyltransferase
MFFWIRKNKLILILVLSVLIFSIYVRYKIINGSLPYIGHPDEPALTSPALKMLKTGDFNPHTFIWPSLPYYLTAASFVYGYVNSVSHRKIKNTSEMGSVSYPFFSEKRLAFPAKALFALLSAVGMLLTGMIAYNLFHKKHLIYLSPLLLLLSHSYLYHSARYLNIDIIGTFFAVLAIFYIAKKLRNDSFLHKAIVPGILCGLAIASKYNFYLLLIPSALSIFFYSKEHKMKKFLLLISITLLAFVVCVPYSVLDFNTFLDGIGFNIYHYKSGHAGHSGTPGFPQFLYYCNSFIDQFGYGFIAFTILGILLSLISKTKKGMILLSFPLLLLIYMSTLTVHFTRNILVIYVLVCIYCSLGIYHAFKYLYSLLENFPLISRQKLFQKAIPVLLIIAVISIPLPIESLKSAYDLKPDSRNLASHWLESNLALDSVILVPEELDLDTRELKEKYRVQYFNGLNAEWNFPEHLSGAYVLVPYYGYDLRDPNGKEVSSRLNTSFKNIDKIVEFGKQPVLVNYHRAVPAGNPKFFIGRIRVE